MSKMKSLPLDPAHGPYFALVDPGNRPDLAQRLGKWPAGKKRNLWEGDLGAQLADVAPHLVQLNPQNGQGRFLTNKLGHDGVLLTSAASLEELTAHFRHLMMVAAPPLGSALHFRFYDPRVWDRRLAGCPRRDVAGLFGPVMRFILYLEGEPPRVWERDSRGKPIQVPLQHLQQLVASRPGGKP